MNIKNKMIVIALAITFLFRPIVSAKASSNYDVESTSYENKIDKESIHEEDGTRKVTFYDEEKEKEEYFIFYKNENKIYSSITNQEVYLDDIYDNEISTKSVKTSTKTYYISYAKLRSLTGSTATVSSLVSSIATILDLTTLGKISAATAILSIAGRAIPNQNNHDIRVTLSENKYYRYGNSVAYRVTRTFKGASLY